MFPKKPEPSFPGALRSAPNGATFSVIAADVVIRGNIEASTDLHVDGTVEGDITCAALAQGEGGRIEGAVKAESARLSGTVNGAINVSQLVVTRGARIEGDVHYETLTVEPGGSINGRLVGGAAAQEDEPRLALAG